MATRDEKTPAPPPRAKEESLTHKAQLRLLDADRLDAGIEAIHSQLREDSIRDYFSALLDKHGRSLAEAVAQANLDKDFGRQLLTGKRGGRRDYYIQLAFGIGLSLDEAQSMLAYLGIGSLYALRERDAALIYALLKGYDLMETQFLLERNGLTPLGDAETSAVQARRREEARRLQTVEMEQQLRAAEDFEEFSDEMDAHFTRTSVDAYFSALLAQRRMSRRQLIEKAGLADKANLIFQLLNGTRSARRRDYYIRLALALGLDLAETQRMLKLLKKGLLYPLKKRDAALIYCIDRAFTLEQTQRLLREQQLEEL